MKRLLKNLIGIILPLLLISQTNYGATVLSTTIDRNQIDGVNGVKWVAENVYIKEIEVLRSHKNEAFSITVSEGPLIRAWRYSGSGNSKKEQEFEQTMTAVSGIISAYEGSLSVNHTNGYEVLKNTANRNRLTFKLEYLNETIAKPTIMGKRTINIAGSVPDGRHNIYTNLIRKGKIIDVAIGTIIIKTLPTISVDDIDFRDQPLGKNINLRETSNIRIESGTEGEKYSLSLESITGSGNINNFVMNLTNANNPNEKIPVQMSVQNMGNNPTLGPGGNADLILEAKIVAPSPSKGGEYTGRAKIIFQYD